MAVSAYTAKIGQLYAEGVSATLGNAADPVAALAAVTTAVAAAKGADKTAFESALATLVADGASPTQAHVTAANSAYTTLAADIAAINTTAATATLNADVTLMFDPAKVVTNTTLAHVMRQLLRLVSGSATLTK